MALSNYGELKASVADWLIRSDDDDIVARVPDFIAIAERRIFRELRCPANEIATTYTGYDSDAGLPLPLDYLEMRTVRWNGMALKRLGDRDSRTQMTGDTPQYFARQGVQLKLYPAPTESGELELTYYQDQSGLAQDDDACNVLLIAPDLYLYGALMEAEPFVENDQRLALWERKYTQSLQQLQEMAGRAEIAGGTMTTRGAY